MFSVVCCPFCEGKNTDIRMSKQMEDSTVALWRFNFIKLKQPLFKRKKKKRKYILVKAWVFLKQHYNH